MAFLSKDDLKLSILTEELDEITREDAAVVTQALSSAESEMRVYLYDSYDVDTIFAASGAARHPVLLQNGVDIAIYRVCAACQAGIDLSDRQDRYDNAIAWLKEVKKSGTYADLPRRTTTKQTHITWGSKTKRENSF